MFIEQGLESFAQSRLRSLSGPESGYMNTFGLIDVARYALPIERELREELSYGLTGKRHEEIVFSRLTKLVETAYSSAEGKYESIGLTPSLHLLFFRALIQGDTKRLERIAAISEFKLRRQQSSSEAEATATYIYDHTMMQKHDNLIHPQLKKYEKTPQKELHVLVGIPGSGKTELATAIPQLSPERILHCDVDIAQRIINPNFDHTDQHQIAGGKYEAWRYTDRESFLAIERNISVCIHTPLARDSWMDPEHPILAHAKASGYSITLHVILRPVFDCYRRAQFRERMVAPKDFLFALHGYEHVIPFARMHGAFVRLYDYRSYIQQRVNLPDPIGDTYSKPLLHSVDGTTVHLIPQSGDIAILKSH